MGNAPILPDTRTKTEGSQAEEQLGQHSLAMSHLKRKSDQK